MAGNRRQEIKRRIEVANNYLDRVLEQLSWIGEEYRADHPEYTAQYEEVFRLLLPVKDVLKLFEAQA